jgi:hypothetical protein
LGPSGFLLALGPDLDVLSASPDWALAIPGADVTAMAVDQTTGRIFLATATSAPFRWGGAECPERGPVLLRLDPR